MLQLVPAHTQNVSTRRWTTMVVEDDPTLRNLVRRILTKLDFDVVVAGDANEALELARTKREGIDVVVTDVVMPGMDGFELASRLTAIHPTARVLFLTGYAEESPSVRGKLGLGCAFLEKPFSQVALVDQIFGLLSGPDLPQVKGS